MPRAVVVWAAFAASSAVAVGALWLAAPARRDDAGLEHTPSEASAGALVGAGLAATPRIAPRDATIDRTRWKAIVIHDSRSPAGDVASIERRHLDAGLAGLGYHFVIGNGQGMDDGGVAVGYRWERQLPGAHATASMRAPRATRANPVAVCLVGNGDRRPFTERQVRELAALVRALQAEFGIGSADVLLRSELAADGSMAHFPATEFRSALLP
jgi:hypothetical protein